LVVLARSFNAMAEQMPETPKEWRRWIIEKAASNLQEISDSIKTTKAQLKSCTDPRKRRSHTKALSEWQRLERELKRDLKRWSG
jgi:predicted  nucleic acid-binding Zn-ribbon protein